MQFLYEYRQEVTEVKNNRLKAFLTAENNIFSNHDADIVLVIVFEIIDKDERVDYSPLKMINKNRT